MTIFPKVGYLKFKRKQGKIEGQDITELRVGGAIREPKNKGVRINNNSNDNSINQYTDTITYTYTSTIIHTHTHTQTHIVQ